MKKLALALVCLVSVAFFASCDPTIQNPEPVISIVAEEGFLTDAQENVLDMDVAYPYGFMATSNTQTLKELSRMVIVCGGTTLCDTAISGTAFTYKGEIIFTDSDDSREIVDHYEIVATVTDVAGQTASATIKIALNKETALVTTPFEWRRDGGADGTGLEEFGLQWTSNTSTNAIIKPLDGATLYRFAPEVWGNTNTEIEKATLFSEQQIGIAQFSDVSVTAQSQEYDIVLGTTYNGVNHLIHVTGSTANQRSWHFTITGEAK
jgi:hypothetical protein